MHGSVVLGETYGFFLIDERYYEQLNLRVGTAYEQSSYDGKFL